MFVGHYCLKEFDQKRRLKKIVKDGYLFIIFYVLMGLSLFSILYLPDDTTLDDCLADEEGFSTISFLGFPLALLLLLDDNFNRAGFLGAILVLLPPPADLLGLGMSKGGLTGLFTRIASLVIVGGDGVSVRV